MAIACLLIPNFPLRVALLERPQLDGQPLVLTSPPSSRTVVQDCTPEAASRGVAPGMLLREVSSLCPEVVFIEPDPVREAAAFDAILDALETISPDVEPGEAGCCWVDLRGLERHDPTPDLTVARLLREIPPVLRPRAGVAPGKFTAHCVARTAGPGTIRTVEPAQALPFLRTLPTAWLPVPPDMARRFDRLGLGTLADLAALPPAAVQARFGKPGLAAWRLAAGQDDEPVTPRPHIPALVERLTLPAPAASRETLLIGVRQLVERAFSRPDMRDRAVRQAHLQVLIEDNRSWAKVMTFREPAGEERLLEITRHRLSTIELPGAAEELVLELVGIVPQGGAQQLLPGLRQRRTRPLIEAARQLRQRYGHPTLYRVMEVEPWSRIPERRHALISYDP